MKFKVEVTMLVVAIALFIAATFFYSYHATTGALTLSESAVYPYRIVALAFVGVGALSMVSASISYSRKTKNLLAQTA